MPMTKWSYFILSILCLSLALSSFTGFLLVLGFLFALWHAKDNE